MPYPPQGILSIAGKEAVDTTRFYIQDPSTLLAPMLLAPQPGETIADLCAAPGGKSLILAEMLNGAGKLLCRDRSPERLKSIQENLRLWNNVQIEEGDAAADALPKHAWDAILLDVPCSNTGVIRRRPDVRWHFSLNKLQELVALQQRILENCADAVRPGGRIIYSTCSLEEEENLACGL